MIDYFYPIFKNDCIKAFSTILRRLTSIDVDHLMAKAIQMGALQCMEYLFNNYYLIESQVLKYFQRNYDYCLPHKVSETIELLEKFQYGSCVEHLLEYPNIYSLLKHTEDPKEFTIKLIHYHQICTRYNVKHKLDEKYFLDFFDIVARLEDNIECLNLFLDLIHF